MASQYQIYGASLTAMCNMYRMANDSEEPIVFGELANKIRNYHKDPIYPAGCSIISINSVFGMTDIQKYPLSERPEKANKISLDGSADTYYYYDNGTGYFYSDNDIYLSRYGSFLSQGSGGIDLPQHINVKFYRCEWSERDKNCRLAYNLVNLMAYNNLRGAYLYEPNEAEIEWVNKNSKIQSIRGDKIVPRYLTYIEYGAFSTHADNIDFPSTMCYATSSSSISANNIVFKSPFIANQSIFDSIESYNNFNIKLCNDLIYAPNVSNIMNYYSQKCKKLEGMDNIYLMSTDFKGGYRYSIWNLPTVQGEKTINIRGYNNQPIYFGNTYPWYVFLSPTNMCNSDIFLNIQDDIYFGNGAVLFWGTTSNAEVPSVKKLPHFKNLYSFNGFLSTNLGYSPNITRLEEGAFYENIKGINTVIINMPWVRDDITYHLNSPILTINGIVYATNRVELSSRSYDFYAPNNYNIRLYSENSVYVDIGMSSTYTNVHINGDLYLWGNAYNTSSIQLTATNKCRYNVHIKKGSCGEWRTYKGYQELSGLSLRGPNYGNGIIDDNFIKVGEGHYVEKNYGWVHIYEYDTCPFEVNKEIPSYE